uniref:HAD family phosphatase n=1 Tax=Rhabditophanes sp. KR3021 TaxID=114890 RepID=A0AC35TWV5_9BILA
MVVSIDKSIKACIFDMGGVILVYPDAKVQKAVHSISAQNVPEELKQLDIGAISIEDIISSSDKDSQVHKFFAGGNTDDLIKSLIRDANFEKCIEVLKTNNIKTALLTNNFFIDKEKTRTTIMSDVSVFDVVVESCRVGLRKPDAAIYQLALDKLGLQGNECIFVDDLKMNCDGAEVLGIRAVHVDGGNSENAVNEIGEILGLSIL